MTNPGSGSQALVYHGYADAVEPIDLGKLVQKEAWTQKLDPNGRFPTIVDRDADDFAVFESGAILIYLAEKSGQLLPTDAMGRCVALHGLMFHVAA